jgi:hypothetical protein
MAFSPFPNPLRFFTVSWMNFKSISHTSIVHCSAIKSLSQKHPNTYFLHSPSSPNSGDSRSSNSTLRTSASATMPSSKHPSTSSKKAHNGSDKGLKSSKRVHNDSSQGTSLHSLSHTHTHTHSQQWAQEELIERYVSDERDYRSYAVKEYDLCQEEARRKHDEGLREVMGKKY